MNFIARLVGKLFRYFMLFAIVLLGIGSVESFMQSGGSLLSLLANLAILYLIYRYLVPWVERLIVLMVGAGSAPQPAARRRGGVVERFADSTGKAVGDWILGATATKPSTGPTPWEIENKRAWKKYQAKKREDFHTAQAKKCPGTYDSYVSASRAKQAREDAKRY